MKSLTTLYSILVAVSACLSACQVSSGAAELTPLGPSLVEMTPSVTPPTLTAILATTSAPASPIQTATSVAITLSPTQRPASPASTRAIPTMPPSAGLVTITPTPCGLAWFTLQATPGSCPNEPAVQLEAAYQPFEHGAMLWRKRRGYIILPFNPATEVQFGIISFYPDEVTVYRDTSGEVSPPYGMLAPSSGFGLLWRGDVFAEQGFSFQTLLGWATATETGYTLTEQNGSQPVSYGGVTSVSLISYFTLPDGRLLRLSRLANPNQPTTLSFITPQHSRRREESMRNHIISILLTSILASACEQSLPGATQTYQPVATTITPTVMIVLPEVSPTRAAQERQHLSQRRRQLRHRCPPPGP